MEMNVKLALIAGVVLIVVIALIAVLQPGLIFMTEEAAAEKEFKDCGTDLDCFSLLLNDCSPGKVKIDSPGLVWSMAVKELKQGQCHTVFFVEDVSLDAPQLFIYPEELKKKALDFKGKSMDCIMPLEGDVNITPQEAVGFCQGELKDVLEETGKAFSEYQAKLYLVNEDCLPGKLWETKNSTYEIFGIVTVDGTDYCKTVYSFQIPNRFSKIEFSHYAGFVDEFMEVDFPKNVEPPEEFFNEWCESSEKWTETALGGTAKILSVESRLYEETPACKFEVLIQPVSELLPASTIEAYSLQDGRSAVIAKTNNYNTFQFTFEKKS